jgi:glycine dehydrogenase
MSDMSLLKDDETDPRTAQASVQVPDRAEPGWDSFAWRHVGPRPEDLSAMLGVCGCSSLEELIDKAVPTSIRLQKPLQLPPAGQDHELLAELKGIAARNKVFRSFIGAGYYDCITPPVIQRNILENPGWYSQYTPYQSEIAQGRLEALLNFQTMVIDLTGMGIANASLLDEGTAAAEAVMMCWGIKGRPERKAVFISRGCHPQTIEVVRTRASALGLELVVDDAPTFEGADRVFAALIQYPDTFGRIPDLGAFGERMHRAGALVIVATDLLGLTLLKPPGELGADVVVGNSQRFGVPLGLGGPHAAFYATRDSFKRHMPGRLVGVSRDAQGRPALRLALQTREQHIRREKATSNICTAQVLLAVMASMYAVYHGPRRLRQIAERVHTMTGRLHAGLSGLGLAVEPEMFFDTLSVTMDEASCQQILHTARQRQINLRRIDSHTLGISLDEATTETDLQTLLEVFRQASSSGDTALTVPASAEITLPLSYRRSSFFLTHPVFNRYHSETEMLRYIRRLESRDLSLTTSMIPLGSCTMKLNATAEMYPISWPEFNRLHPFVPADQAEGYLILFRQLEMWLAEITGFHAVSFQPNAGSQGEYTGLLVIRQYHQSRGQGDRRVCLIPTSAHGTNPASAVMAGLRVVPVQCDAKGNIDLGDLKAQAAAHGRELAALMVTYPSTHGVFEEGIREACRLVHEHGGLVYLDGANMNAQVGLCRPAEMGADVCHLNLHKTFCIPHGGGGPGVGPICVAAHLAPFLPRHPWVATGGPQGIGPIAAGPWGSPSILPISWMYIRLMGARGLTLATSVAVLNANYIARRLERYFPVLFKGRQGLVAHECILDLRQYKSITVEDVAKRLMDFGFHAPTISWPVAGTMMVEPTESESKAELDRFCEALITIHGEILAVENGEWDPRNNPLKQAPHTAAVVAADHWERPYSREQAVYPAPWLREHKFWPAVGRVDNLYGDRNPVCSCPGVEDHAPSSD